VTPILFRAIFIYKFRARTTIFATTWRRKKQQVLVNIFVNADIKFVTAPSGYILFKGTQQGSEDPLCSLLENLKRYFVIRGQ
jgi:hypothetical protein